MTRIFFLPLGIALNKYCIRLIRVKLKLLEMAGNDLQWLDFSCVGGFLGTLYVRDVCGLFEDFHLSYTLCTGVSGHKWGFGLS